MHRALRRRVDRREVGRCRSKELIVMLVEAKSLCMVGAMILAVAIILARGSETLNCQIITVCLDN